MMYVFFLIILIILIILKFEFFLFIINQEHRYFPISLVMESESKCGDKITYENELKTIKEIDTFVFAFLEKEFPLSERKINIETLNESERIKYYEKLVRYYHLLDAIKTNVHNKINTTMVAYEKIIQKLYDETKLNPT